MLKLYYFYNFGEGGEMNILDFETEQELDLFLERHQGGIDVFDIREC